MTSYDPYAPLDPRIAEKLTKQSLRERVLAFGGRQEYMQHIISILNTGGDVDEKLTTLLRTRKEWFR